MGKAKKHGGDGSGRCASSARLAGCSESSEARKQANDKAGRRPPHPSKYKTFAGIEGGTLNRFVSTKPGTTLRKLAEDADRICQCVACKLPHNPMNAMCWGASHAGPPPPVLRGSPGQMYSVVTGKYLGRFTFTETNAWPRSRFTEGVLKF